MEAGDVTAELLELNATLTPPVGAAFDNVTVQLVDEPALTVEGEQVREESTTGATNVRVVDIDDPLRLAVNWAVVSVVLLETAALKVALV